MEKLKTMKHKLTECVEKQINGNLEYTNANKAIIGRLRKEVENE